MYPFNGCHEVSIYPVYTKIYQESAAHAWLKEVEVLLHMFYVTR